MATDSVRQELRSCTMQKQVLRSLSLSCQKKSPAQPFFAIVGVSAKESPTALVPAKVSCLILRPKFFCCKLFWWLLGYGYNKKLETCFCMMLPKGLLMIRRKNCPENIQTSQTVRESRINGKPQLFQVNFSVFINFDRNVQEWQDLIFLSDGPSVLLDFFVCRGSITKITLPKMLVIFTEGMMFNFVLVKWMSVEAMRIDKWLKVMIKRQEMGYDFLTKSGARIRQVDRFDISCTVEISKTYWNP